MGKTSLRVMSINLENLFSPGRSFYGQQYTASEYQNKLNWVGSMIGRHQVQVVALTELGEDAGTCIQDVIRAANDNDETGWAPFQYEFRAQPSAGGTKIRNGVISRFEISQAESLTAFVPNFRVDLHLPGTDEDKAENWVDVPVSEFSRPVAKVRVTPTNGTAFNLFVVHLKSKRPIQAVRDGRNESIGIARAAVRRNVEAAALRFYLDAFLAGQYDTDPKIPSLLAGDFNDGPSSVPVENIRGSFDNVPGPGRPWSRLDTIRLISCARLHLKKSAYEDKLFSYIHNENFTLLDQIFVTEHLTGRFKRFEVYNDHVFRHQDLSTPTDQEKQWKSMVSDHGVVVAEFIRML